MSSWVATLGTLLVSLLSSCSVSDCTGVECGLVGPHLLEHRAGFHFLGSKSAVCWRLALQSRLCDSFPTCTLSGDTLVAWNWPQWDCFHQGPW